MAMAKPVVVSSTTAIMTGYHLEDGVNCRLVAPGSLAALSAATSELLADDARAATLGIHARETVEASLSWSSYASTMAELLMAAASSR
jgi:glycosyltransferase involved in cell wall biosynthesis